MARKTAKKASNRKVGAWGFYHWRGESFPAIITRVIPDDDDTVGLTVFTNNGPMVVPRASVGNGDIQFGENPEPAVPVSEPEEQAPPPPPLDEDLVTPR